MLPETADAEWYARRYCKLGWAVIPLRAGTKIPIFDNWPRLATSNVETVLKWLKQYPDCNLGVALGTVSHLCCLDFDLRHGGMETLSTYKFQHGQLNTVCANTGGGGYHAFFRTPNFTLRSIPKFDEGVELRSEGNQVVVCPSIHPDTHQRYEWDMGDDEFDLVSQLPQWAIDRVLHGATRERRQLSERMARAPEKLLPGGRHNTLLAYGGFLRAKGASADEIEGFLQVMNERRCDPPHDRAHVRTMAESLVRYEPDDPRLARSISKVYSRLQVLAEAELRIKDEYKPLTATEILMGGYHAPKEVIAEMIHEGLTILAGPPKIGKSFLAMQMAIAVACGAKLFGEQEVVRPGRVAYMSCEEGRGQTYKKLDILRARESGRIDNIDLYYAQPKLPGAIDEFKRIIEETNPTIMIIDSLRAISTEGRLGDVVMREYNMVKPLSDLGKETGTAIVLIHHTRKGSQGDSLIDSFAGSGGITAPADCLVRLSADGSVFLLEGTGREIEEFNFALEKKFNKGLGWQMKAKGEDARLTEERQDIFDLLREEGCKSPKEISSSLGKNGAAIRRLLKKMRAAGNIHKASDGKYINLGDEV